MAKKCNCSEPPSKMLGSEQLQKGNCQKTVPSLISLNRYGPGASILTLPLTGLLFPAQIVQPKLPHLQKPHLPDQAAGPESFQK